MRSTARRRGLRVVRLVGGGSFITITGICSLVGSLKPMHPIQSLMIWALAILPLMLLAHYLSQWWALDFAKSLIYASFPL
jgi:hypothetical protein